MRSIRSKMNIREALLAEHSKRRTLEIVDHIGEDPARFGELMKIFFAGPYRVTQRAASPINYCAERHPKLIRPFFKRLVAELERADVHDAVRRNILRSLQFVEIPHSLKARLYSLSLKFIADGSQPVAVKVFATTVARKIAESEPVLMNELRLVVTQQLPHESIAFHKRARGVV